MKNFLILMATSLTIVGGFFIFSYFYSPINEDISISDNKEIERGAYLFNIKIDGLDLNVEFADTEEARSIGLSGRNKMKEDQGMLFAFDSVGFYSFWMKDMSFPLDIIWIGEDFKIVDIMKDIQPTSYPQRFQSEKMSRYVLEVNAGLVKNHKIEVGMKVLLDNAFPYLKIKEGSIEEIIEESPSATSPNILEVEPEPSNNNAVDITENENSILSDSQTVMLDVPFTSQAPFGGWSDARRENGCEEASAIMAMAWVRGEKLTSEYSDSKILEISDYEQRVYGDFHDTSAGDTVTRIFNDYFNYQNVKVVYDINVDDIKSELKNGHVVIVPVHGQKVKNPYYTPPGPIQHMLVIVGYDDNKKEFITNDPGTRNGEGYRYGEQSLVNAMQDYPSGIHEPITEIRRAMIVVSK